MEIGCFYFCNLCIFFVSVQCNHIAKTETRIQQRNNDFFVLFLHTRTHSEVSFVFNFLFCFVSTRRDARVAAKNGAMRESVLVTRYGFDAWIFFLGWDLLYQRRKNRNRKRRRVCLLFVSHLHAHAFSLTCSLAH